MAKSKTQTQTPATSAPTPPLPYLVKTVITFTKTNAAGQEQKHKDANIVFELDKAGAKMPWFVLRNYLVPRYLTDKYGPKEVGWQRIYEIKIIKQINRNNPNDIEGIPLRIMTYEQLDLYCTRWQLNVPVFDFYSVEKAREMVKLRLEDEKAYQKHYADYLEGKQRNYPELDGIRRHERPSVVDSNEFDKIDSSTPRPAPKSNANTQTNANAQTKTKGGVKQENDPFQDV